MEDPGENIESRPEISDDVLPAIDALEAGLFGLLRESGPRTDPELTRVWGRLKDDLGTARRLIPAAGGPYASDAKKRLRSLLTRQPGSSEAWTLLFAREFNGSLQSLLPTLGDDAYLLAQLDSENVRERFRRMYGKDELKKWSNQTSLDNDQRARLANQLVQLQLERSNRRRKEHTRQAIRSRQLLKILWILLPLVVVVGYVLASALHTSGWKVAIAALGGALGSVLSGAFKLPGLRRLRDLRSFQAGLFLQPVIGGAAGLVAFILVRTGILHLPSSSTSDPVAGSYSLYGFLAGFSEPFFFGVIKRLSGELLQPAGDQTQPKT
jgi:hypothetical protein